MRQEPTIGTKITTFFGQNKGLDHSKLVDNALEAFTKAEQGMQEAITAIAEEQEKDNEVIREATKRIADAESSKLRLQRVIDRVKAFTA